MNGSGQVIVELPSELVPGSDKNGYAATGAQMHMEVGTNCWNQHLGYAAVSSNPYQAPTVAAASSGDLIGPDFSARPMEVSFQANTEDILAFNVYHHAHSRALKKVYKTTLWLFAAVAALIVLSSLRANGLIGTLPGGMALAVGLGFYVAIHPSVRRILIKWQVSRMLAEGTNAGLFDPHRLSIDQQGIREVTSIGESFRYWRGVEKIAKTPEHAFFYISAISAFVLPRRACESDLQFQEFVRSAEIWASAAASTG